MATASPFLVSASRPSAPDPQPRRRHRAPELENALTVPSTTGYAAAGTRRACHCGAVHGFAFPTWLVEDIPVHPQQRAAAETRR